MHRLSGEDAGFLSMEQPEQAMNTIAIGTLRRPDGSATALTIEDVRTHIAGRLDQLPSFRWRIVPVPFGLHNPMCVRDPDFDLDHHLREITLEPGQTTDERVRPPRRAAPRSPPPALAADAWSTGCPTASRR